MAYPRLCGPLAASLLAVGCTALTLISLCGICYITSASMDSPTRFFIPSRAPSIDEAMLICPIEYALHSEEANDVIFLGGSTCRCGVDPKHIAGLRAFNLGSLAGLKPDGIFATANAYLVHHPAPKAVVLCLSPFAFDFAEDGGWQTELTDRLLSEYVGAPVLERTEHLVRRGFGAFQSRNATDLRDMPLVGNESESFRSYQRAFLANCGLVAMPGEHRSQIIIQQPGVPLNIEPGWIRLVRKLSAECASRDARLIVLITPLSADQAAARDYSALSRWLDAIRGERLATVIGSAITVYDWSLMHDTIHLNSRGVAKFTEQLAKDVQATLAR